MLELYQFQQKIVSDASNLFLTYQRIIIQATTGAGKTVVFSDIVRRAAFKETNVLILTNRVELASETLKTMSVVNAAIQVIDSKNKRISPDAMVNLAMAKTLKNRIKQGLVLNPKLIIIDECHLADFNFVFDVYPNAYVIGLTATPIGKHLYKHYQQMICAPDTPELIEMGFLKPCRAFEMKSEDFSDLKIGSDGDFSQESLSTHFEKATRFQGVIDEYKSKIYGQKTIHFCVNIKHTIETCKNYNDAGISAKYVTGKTPDNERKQIFLEFKHGLFLVLVNCGVAIFGFNEPSIKGVMLDFATTSLAKFLQTIGRGSRIFDDKPYFTVIDFGGNHSRHGLWSEPRTWQLKPPKKKKEAAAPMKDCPNCSAMLPASVRKCNFCQYEWPESEMILMQGVAVEVTDQMSKDLMMKRHADLTIKEIKKLVEYKKIKSVYAWRLVRYRGVEALEEYAGLCGYNKGWIRRQFDMLTDEEKSEIEARNSEKIMTV